MDRMGVVDASGRTEGVVCALFTRLALPDPKPGMDMDILFCTGERGGEAGRTGVFDLGPELELEEESVPTTDRRMLENDLATPSFLGVICACACACP